MTASTIIHVGMSTCNLAAGSQAVFNACTAAAEQQEDVAVKKTGCLGTCYLEPNVRIEDASGSTLYCHVDAKKMDRIFKDHVLAGKPVTPWVIREEEAGAIMGKQQRHVLAHCGRIDPEDIDAYRAVSGYEALEKVLRTMTPDRVINEIIASGLRGRGGAGFPTGLKWKFARREKGDKKYMICNADEGDPGAFMDRTTLESDPHSVLEGMAIGGYATGSDEGTVYCRAEYPLAIQRLARAIEQAEDKGLLGRRILGTDFSFVIRIKEGAGAFVCGEETALLASMEGQRGMPRPRPPYPAQSGLFGKPTTINNVETWANIPSIIRNGATSFADLGTEKSKGTKVFALAGKIKRGGLIEVPMGISLREIIYDIGGGAPSGREIKAVQMGGPSGGCVPVELFDTCIDYDEVVKTGAIMGSGGMVVLDDTTCMVDVARYFLQFTQHESCGKCTFCRIGTKRMLEILNKICAGDGIDEDLETLEDLAHKVKHTSLCGLGQTAPNPVLSTLRYYRHEYEEHIREKRCRAGKCAALCTYVITEACTGCTVCARRCPVNAIFGEKRGRHVIDQDLCIQCGVCRDVCKFDAVEIK